MAHAPRGWRRVALASWPKPHDPTTYGILELDAAPALAYLESVRWHPDVTITLLALVLKALAHAMAQEPASTRMLRFGRWVDRAQLDLFIQVDREGRDLSGLKLENVPAKSLVGLAREIASRAGAVRADQSAESLRRSVSVTDRIPMPLMPLALWIQDVLSHDLRMRIPALGVFPDPFGAAMVTNIGSLGLDLALPPVPPISRCSLVIAMGLVQEKPWVVNGHVVARPILPLGVAVDHRVLDGAQASRLAKAFRAVMAEPARFFGPDGLG